MKQTFILRILASLMVLAVLSGCKLGHKYQRPQLSMPELYMADEQNRLAEMSWFEVYSDTTLQRLISKALEHNKEVLASEARLRQFAARKRISLANLLPQVQGNAYAQREGLNYGGDNFSGDPETGIKLSASWELDIWGEKRWERDKSIALWMASVENRRDIIVSVIADVATAYFQLVALDNELQMVRNTLYARQEGVRLAKLRFEGGLTSETSYQQAQVEYARTATHVPVLEKAIDLKQNEIAYLIGEYPCGIARSASLQSVAWADTIPVSLSSSLLERRPDIRRAEQMLVAANAAAGAANAHRFPTISLVAIGGVESDAFSDLLRSPMNFLSASIAGPVFDMGKRQAEYRASQWASQEQALEYERVVLQAFREVSDAITAFGKIKEICESMTSLRDGARTTTELAQLQYINGVIGYIDLLDAQRSYFDAQVSVINAERDKRIALVNLYRALGGGW